MKRLIASIGTAAIVSFTAGCSTPLPQSSTVITIQSNPIGARVYNSAGQSKAAPATLRWDNVIPNSTSDLLTAVWPSGAKTTFKLRLVPGAKQTYVVQRPTNVPGLDADMAWALRLAQREAEADAALNESMKTFGQGVGQLIGAKK